MVFKMQSKLTLEFEQHFLRGWWRLFVFCFFCLLVKLEVLVLKILMEKQHFKWEDLLSRYSDT